jgi:hypothetical protein
MEVKQQNVRSKGTNLPGGGRSDLPESCFASPIGECVRIDATSRQFQAHFELGGMRRTYVERPMLRRRGQPLAPGMVSAAQGEGRNGVVAWCKDEEWGWGSLV